jgi:hypothetical protein
VGLNAQKVSLKKLLVHKDALLFWPGLFFLALGFALTYQGVERFNYPGHTGTPALLYWLGAGFIALATLRLILTQSDKAAMQRKALNRAANQRRKTRNRNRKQFR